MSHNFTFEHNKAYHITRENGIENKLRIQREAFKPIYNVPSSLVSATITLYAFRPRVSFSALSLFLQAATLLVFPTSRSLLTQAALSFDHSCICHKIFQLFHFHHMCHEGCMETLEDTLFKLSSL